MIISLKNLIFYFSSRDINDKRELKTLTKYIENLNFAIDDQIYINED